MLQSESLVKVQELGLKRSGLSFGKLRIGGEKPLFLARVRLLILVDCTSVKLLRLCRNL